MTVKAVAIIVLVTTLLLASLAVYGVLDAQGAAPWLASKLRPSTRRGGGPLPPTRSPMAWLALGSTAIARARSR
jgi:hypothetical protein